MLDSNIFITPCRTYYPFDFAHGFWKQLESNLRDDNVIILDVVALEICRLDDELSRWILSLKDFKPVSVQSALFVTSYEKVLSYVQNCGFYKEEALRN